jgi:hypothetical protein
MWAVDWINIAQSSVQWQALSEDSSAFGVP